MSSYHLSFQNAPFYLSAISKYNVRYLLGYASSLLSLALAVLNNKCHVPDLKVILSNAEPLFDHQRKLIEKAFKCPVRDTYGMTEIVAASSECNKKINHLWPEVGIIEVFDESVDQPVKNGTSGRLICTGLINDIMPLIRYDIGDSGTLAPEGQMCECGRNLPILLNVQGRSDDLIYTKDGRRIGRLDPVFKSDFPILEAQIVQEKIDSLRVRFVPGSNYDEKYESILEERIKERVGDMNIIFEPVEHIPRSANGKFRAVISRIGKNDLNYNRNEK
jgi:phenylacetate-CoA ligase